jgi:hypothetical protein
MFAAFSLARPNIEARAGDETRRSQRGKQPLMQALAGLLLKIR